MSKQLPRNLGHELCYIDPTIQCSQPIPPGNAKRFPIVSEAIKDVY